MTSEMKKYALDTALKVSSKSGGAAAVKSDQAALGMLPEWNLADLYPSTESSELKADLKKADELAVEFEKRWKGNLATEAAEPSGGNFAQSIQEFEVLEELIGKIVSFAGLVYAGDTSDPKRAKLYGDIQQKMTDASTHLIFYSLELNRIDDAVIEKAMDDNPAIAHYRPWLVDLRKDKPYQLDDKIEQLFHEKSITGRGAWNRLFDETMTALRFEVNGEELPLEPTLNLLQDADASLRKAGFEALAKTFKENLRIFTLITNTLAKDKEISDRWRGFEDIADSRHLANRVEREVVDALSEAVQAAYPRLSHRYYALKAKWLGLDYLNNWDRNAPCRKPRRRSSRGPMRVKPCFPPIMALHRKWPISRGLSSTRTGSMHQRAPASHPAPSLIRRFPQCIPMCCSTIWASRVM